MKRKLLWALLTAACVALAGCGGGSGSGTEAGPRKQASEEKERGTRAPIRLDNVQTADSIEAAAGNGAGEAENDGSGKAEAPGTGNEGAADAGKSGSESPAESAGKLFRDFLAGEEQAVVDDAYIGSVRGFDLRLAGGESFTLGGLTDMLKESDTAAGLIGEPRVETAELTVPGGCGRGLRVSLNTPGEQYEFTAVFSEEDDGLKLVFAADGWTRRYISLSSSGVVSEGGSNGAGDHEYEVWAPDRKLRYHALCKGQEIGEGYTFYDGDGPELEKVNGVVNAVYESGKVDGTSVVFTRTRVGDRAMYCFGGVNGMKQDTVDTIDGIAAQYGFRFDGQKAVDDAVKARAEELGITADYNGTAEVTWHSV